MRRTRRKGDRHAAQARAVIRVRRARSGRADGRSHGAAAICAISRVCFSPLFMRRRARRHTGGFSRRRRARRGGRITCDNEPLRRAHCFGPTQATRPGRNYGRTEAGGRRIACPVDFRLDPHVAPPGCDIECIMHGVARRVYHPSSPFVGYGARAASVSPALAARAYAQPPMKRRRAFTRGLRAVGSAPHFGDNVRSDNRIYFQYVNGMIQGRIPALPSGAGGAGGRDARMPAWRPAHPD